MYIVTLDGQLLYDPRVEELAILSPELDLEAGKVGGFDFKMIQGHPLFDRIHRLKSIIEVYQDELLLFRGRALNDTTDFYNTKAVICEGELAYFNDSIVRPYEYAGSVQGYLQMLIDQHNAQMEPEKRFALGRLTVTDPNNYIPRSDSTFPNTWNVLNEKLVNRLGGYLILRRENGINYLDYLSDCPYFSEQVIRLGENLLDVKQLKRSEAIATAIIPLGAPLENDARRSEVVQEQKLTIESVNGGKDYVFSQAAVDRYGWVYKTVDFENVHTPEILKERGEASLANAILTDMSIELTAVDLSLINLTIDQFRFFEYVTVDSLPHGLSAKMLVTKINIDLTDPSKSLLSIGSRVRTFTEKQLTTTATVNQIAAVYSAVEPQIYAIQKDVGVVQQDVGTVQNELGVFQTDVDAELKKKANLQSPALTGMPTAPTAAQAVNNTQIATTEYAQKAAEARMPGTMVVHAANTSLNAITAVGFHSVITTVDVPPGVSGWLSMIVTRYNNDAAYIQQFVISEQGVYSRRMTAGTWSAWQSFTLT